MARGAVDAAGVLPHLEQLARQPHQFAFDFGQPELPKEPGMLLVRGPRQYGKSTWLELGVRQTIQEFAPGSAYCLSGDEIPDEEALVLRCQETLTAGVRAQARRVAASRDTTVNALVRDYLKDLVGRASFDAEALVRELESIYARTSVRKGPRSWTRQVLHER